MKVLIILDNHGSIINILDLDRNILNQPEGICFSENGDLFISNENKNGTANILRFNSRVDIK